MLAGDVPGDAGLLFFFVVFAVCCVYFQRFFCLFCFVLVSGCAICFCEVVIFRFFPRVEVFGSIFPREVEEEEVD